LFFNPGGWEVMVEGRRRRSRGRRRWHGGCCFRLGIREEHSNIVVVVVKTALEERIKG